MKITTVTDFEQNLEKLIQYTIEEAGPVFIARDGGRNLVMIGLDEFDKMRGSITNQISESK